jgi:hypothetical protein
MSWFPSRAHAGTPRRTTIAARLLIPICGVTALALSTRVTVVASRSTTPAERQATATVE